MHCNARQRTSCRLFVSSQLNYISVFSECWKYGDQCRGPSHCCYDIWYEIIALYNILYYQALRGILVILAIRQNW